MAGFIPPEFKSFCQTFYSQRYVLREEVENAQYGTFYMTLNTVGIGVTVSLNVGFAGQMRVYQVCSKIRHFG